MTVENEYAKSLRHALEYVYVVAARRGIDTGQLLVVIDAGRAPGIYQEHTLTISVRDTHLVVTAEGIPQDWLAIGTGFIDTRLSQRIAVLMSELEKKWAGL
jgi:hypothetical protein